jgi:hypothetical protein
MRVQTRVLAVSSNAATTQSALGGGPAGKWKQIKNRPAAASGWAARSTALSRTASDASCQPLGGAGSRWPGTSARVMRQGAVGLPGQAKNHSRVARAATDRGDTGGSAPRARAAPTQAASGAGVGPAVGVAASAVLVAVGVAVGRTRPGVGVALGGTGEGVKVADGGAEVAVGEGPAVGDLVRVGTVCA